MMGAAISPHTRGIESLGDGRLILRDDALAVFRWVDAQFETMAAQAGAVAVQVPALIERRVLERAGFFEAFGESATRCETAARIGTHVLTPALCYHAYPHLAGRRLDAPVLLTSVGRCYRSEPDGPPSLARLWEFTMREVVFVGAGAWVEAERRRWMDRVAAFASSIGLAARLEAASDPFFGGAARGRKLMQQLKELKYELRTSVGPDEPPAAVASMNLHETFFGARFGLVLADGSTAASGCVAFGLERWTLAVMAQLGPAGAAARAG